MEGLGSEEIQQEIDRASSSSFLFLFQFFNSSEGRRDAEAQVKTCQQAIPPSPSANVRPRRNSPRGSARGARLPFLEDPASQGTSLELFIFSLVSFASLVSSSNSFLSQLYFL